MTYKIFFAWQSQKKSTANFLKRHLDKAKRHLKNDQIYVDVIKSPTQDESGSPNINTCIWKQIQDADVFIADLSFLSRVKTSNDNVMYELGIADSLLGENRTILLCDESTKIERLAFDINHKRISPFNTENVYFYLNLSEWIKMALLEADKERFNKLFFLEDFSSELISITNYFYRLAFYSDGAYSSGFSLSSEKEIQDELKKVRIGLFEAKPDYSEVIKNLEVKLQNYASIASNMRIIWHMLNIISALRDFQLYNRYTKYGYVVVQPEKEEYALFDSNTFFLKEGFEIANAKGIAFFDDNFIFSLNSKDDIGYGIILDKRTISLSDANCSLVSNDPFTMVKSAVVMFDDKYINYLAKYIYGVINALNSFFEYCGFELNNIGKNKTPIGVISIKLK